MDSFNTIYNNVVKNGYDFGTGSWAVISNKISMKLDEYGEYHPVLKDASAHFSASEVSSLKQVCLSTSQKNEDDIAKELYSEVPEIQYDERLGYYCGLYVGHVVEGSFRENGSSGGFGTWIFNELLEQNLIDGVIQVAYTGNKNKMFEYTISRNKEDLDNGAKTKYYPVEFSEVIRQIEKTPGRYAVVGLPSYIMELRLLMDQNKILRDRIKYTLGLVCGHQKSTKFAEFLAWQCGIKPGDLTYINFRKKSDHGRANQYSVELIGKKDGKQVTIVKQMGDLIGRNWGEGLFKVRASDFTDDVMNETADVTLGDAWLPEYSQDSKGNNIMVVRSPEIKAIIEAGIKNGKVQLDRVDVETIFRSQSSHYRHTRVELGYRLQKQIKRGRWVPVKRVKPNKELSWIRKKIQDKREQLCLSVPEIYLTAVKMDDLEYFFKHFNPMSKSYKNLYRIKRLRGKVKRLLKK